MKHSCAHSCDAGFFLTLSKHHRVQILCASHQTLLLVANTVDSNADCTRLVVDGWLELELREPEEALRCLSTALTLRAEWERLLVAQLGQSIVEGAEFSGVSRRVMEKLGEDLVRFLLYTEVLMMCSFNPYMYYRYRIYGSIYTGMESIYLDIELIALST